jgi:hypothetical protein
MRPAILAASFLLIATPASAAEPFPARNMPVINPSNPADAKCPPVSPYHAMKDREKVTSRKLSELPAGVHYKAAYRRIDGCEVPIVAGFGVRQPKR